MSKLEPAERAVSNASASALARHSSRIFRSDNCEDVNEKLIDGKRYKVCAAAPSTPCGCLGLGNQLVFASL